MKKLVVFVGIFMFGLLTFINPSYVSATEINVEDTSENVAYINLENEVYSPGSYLELTIHIIINNEDILDISFNGNGFELVSNFFNDYDEIHFTVKHDDTSLNPYFTIAIILSDEALNVELFGLVEDNILFVNPYSFEETNDVYLDYLKQNNPIKYENTQSEFNNSTQMESFTDNQVELNASSEPDTFVSGVLYWQDDNGNNHPLQHTLVELWDKQLIINRLLMETYTNEKGEYNFSFKNVPGIGGLESGGYDIFIRVIPAGEDVVVYQGDGSKYRSEDLWYDEDCPTGNIINPDVIFKMGDGEFEQALQVCQAAIFASKYYEEMKGSDVENVTIKYPHNIEDKDNCFYRDTEQTIYVVKCIVSEDERKNGKVNSYASWDVIMHEYGHHVAYQEGIIDSPKGKHFINKCMAEHYISHFVDDNFSCELNCVLQSTPNKFNENECKYEGLALAWSEGFATYFGQASQEYYKSYLSNIKSVADGQYTAYDIIPIEIENGYGSTEGCENSVQRILYDMYG